MKCITQINATPLVIVIDNEQLLENHPSILDFPNLFEIVELDELPINTQYLHYERNY